MINKQKVIKIYNRIVMHCDYAGYIEFYFILLFFFVKNA